MKIKDLKILREKKLDDLKKLAEDKKKELSVFYSNLKAGKEKNSSKGKGLRKEISQILTLVREDEIKLKFSSDDVKAKLEEKNK